MKTIAKHLIPNAGALILIGLLLLVQAAGAQPADEPAQPLAPSQTFISYQGTLADQNGNPVNGPITMEFALYNDPAAGTQQWGWETQTVQVSNGLFHVLLGSVAPFNLSTSAGDLYLAIKVNGEELAPRELLTSVFHAVQATGTAGDFEMNGHWIMNTTGLRSPAGTGLTIDAGYPSDNTLTLLDDVSIPNGDVSIPNGSLYVAGNVSGVGNVLGQGGQQIHMPPGFANIYFNWHYGANVEFGGGDGVVDVSITPTGIDMHGNTVSNCGALTEANLQTAEERAAERISRFEEGDVMCWGDGQLEKCAQVGDPLVQAVADANGKPIIIGAEVIKVVGPVKRGDFLVASDVPGYAMAARSPAFGTVIAQALEDFIGGQGLIRAMIRKF